MTSDVDCWASFLANDKLTPAAVGQHRVLDLVRLCEALAAIRRPCIRTHSDKLASRRLVCEVAMDMGLDLAGIKAVGRGKPAMGRGLLDAWNLVYTQRFGSTFGTAGAKEVARRGVKTVLADRRNGGAL